MSHVLNPRSDWCSTTAYVPELRREAHYTKRRLRTEDYSRYLVFTGEPAPTLRRPSSAVLSPSCSRETVTLIASARGAERRRAAGAADRKSTRLNSSHSGESRMPSSA